MLLNKFNQVRYRLLALVLLAALPGLLLLGVIARQQWKLAEETAQENAFRVAKESIESTKQQIRDARGILKELSQHPSLQNQDATGCRDKVSKLLQQLPQYANFGAVSADGEVYCSAVPLTTSVNLGDRPWFQQVSQARTLTIGEFQVSPITQTPILALGYPAFNENGRVTSAVFASLKLELLDPTVIQQLPPETTVSILDRQGVVLARHPNPDQWMGKSIQDSALFRELTASQDDAITVAAIEGIDGTFRLFAFSRLNPDQTTDLYVAVGIPDALIREQVAWAMGRYALMVTVPILLVLGLTWYIASVGIQHPIRLLTKAARQLATGDFAARMELPISSNEFGQLASTYNTMAKDLETYINQRIAVQKEREVAELKAQFVAMVSHELRTPLTVIKVSTELLDHFSESASAEQKQRYCNESKMQLIK
ncbi:MAG: HAMP domain-containing protein [Leptolyngbyaceae cyanobacterium RM1_406_9]|nr:HAMP domain-containing protein [Leptolyngbyaceae cyanobacterium RM1_406_9]